MLHLGKYYAPFRGGVETYLLDSLRALAGRGHDCVALVHDHEVSLRTREECHGSAQARWTVVRAATWLKAFFTPISPGFRERLRRLLREFRPDVIHAHLPNPSACWLLTLPAAAGVPLVLHWHSDVITGRQGLLMKGLYRLYRPLERRLLTRAEAIIATSASYLETSESLRAFPEKCHVVPLGLDGKRVLAYAEERAPATSLQPDHLQVLAIGRLTYYKGFGFLVRAIAEVERVELHVVGQGSLRRELRKLVQALGIGNRVRFHGGLDDRELAARLKACDCVCLPSIERTEAFGLVLLEAMAFSRATVSSRLRGSGMSWVVKNEVTGLLVPPRDVAALAQALERLRDDPSLVARLGEAGHDRFSNQFSIDASVDALERVYERIVRRVADA